jgi:hypothetical protein
MNVQRRPEAVATDTVFSDTPAVDSGDMAAQIFVGVESLVTDAEGMKYSDKQFLNTLEDNIRKRGAMDKLISDRARAEVSNKVRDILRALHIKDWQSECNPYFSGWVILMVSLHLRMIPRLLLCLIPYDPTYLYQSVQS